MSLNDIKQKWCEFVAKMNAKGVPLPMVRDPKTGLGSVSLTLVFISFNVVLVGLVGKWVEKLGGLDLSQALNLFYACAALYFGRNLSAKDGTKLEAPGTKASDPQPEQKQPPADNPDSQ